mmetsp:Transcript_51992/g.143992  ORF Transcript_51992/g.143992 Transcript_51992/m.143992 type:complete len:216 (-) Transcript_51992:61-708(-)
MCSISVQFARAARRKATAATAGRTSNLSRGAFQERAPIFGLLSTAHVPVPVRVLQTQICRSFSDGPVSTDTTVGVRDIHLSSPKLDDLYNEITKLSEEEVNILGALVIQVLGRKIFPGEFGRGFEGAAVVPGDVPAEEEEEIEVKTTFAVKLTGFDAKSKIKVIKEVRAIAGLGLKEAKDLVESAPKVVIKDLSNDKAEEMKAQLEAVGAQIEID